LEFKEPSHTLKKVLTEIRANSDKKRFEGTLSNEVIDGFYSSFQYRFFLNSPVISTLKIKGSYNLEEGLLNIRLKRSILFYLMTAPFIVATIYFIWDFYIRGNDLMPSLAFFIQGCFVLVATFILFEYEKWKFKDRLRLLFNEFK
jgi:hypothetical protein